MRERERESFGCEWRNEGRFGGVVKDLWLWFLALAFSCFQNWNNQNRKRVFISK